MGVGKIYVFIKNFIKILRLYAILRILFIFKTKILSSFIKQNYSGKYKCNKKSYKWDQVKINPCHIWIPILVAIIEVILNPFSFILKLNSKSAKRETDRDKPTLLPQESRLPYGYKHISFNVRISRYQHFKPIFNLCDPS